MEFTLNDLKTGHIVKLRNGDFYMVIKGDNVFNLDPILLPLGGVQTWSTLEHTQKNFHSTIDSCLDVVKVYDIKFATVPSSILEVFDIMKGALSCETREEIEKLLEENESTIMYEETIKKMTVAEISKALGYTVEIVEG